jgi:hypothetical protein
VYGGAPPLAVDTFQSQRESALALTGIDDRAGLGDAVARLAEVDRAHDWPLCRARTVGAEPAGTAFEQVEHIEGGDP